MTIYVFKSVTVLGTFTINPCLIEDVGICEPNFFEDMNGETVSCGNGEGSIPHNDIE